MHFNRYVFDYYLATEDGKKAVSFFSKLPDYIEKKAIHEIHIGFSILNFYQSKESLQEDLDFVSHHLLFFKNRLNPANRQILTGNRRLSTNVDSAIGCYKIIMANFLKQGNFTEREWLLWQPALSFSAHVANPNYFIPYLFVEQFYQLELIFNEFSIPLPPLPSLRDYQTRLNYYADICRVLYEFRQNHHLTPAELCAFLYDFAPKTIPDFIGMRRKTPSFRAEI